MHVPVQPRAPRELWVDGREEAGAEKRRNDGAYKVVGEGREEDFVDMEREGMQGERLGDRGGEGS